MMQVEEKPDVTYSDVGGCKEQIEKLREVVETPLLSVRSSHFSLNMRLLSSSQNVSSTLVLILRRESFFLARLAQGKHCALVQ